LVFCWYLRKYYVEMFKASFNFERNVFCFFFKSPVTVISTALARNVAPITNVVSSEASVITITMTMTTMMISRKMPKIGLRISKPNKRFFLDHILSVYYTTSNKMSLLA
jgi:hypothetical protein